MVKRILQGNRARKYCRGYIKRFINDFEKIKSVSDIKDFYFGNLYLNKTYGYDYNTDSDSSELAKVIQYLYFDSILSKKKNKELSEKIELKIKYEKWNLRKNNGKGYYHTIYFNKYPLSNGDTLNTFATLFSKACESSLDGQILEKTKGICRKNIYDGLRNATLKKFHKNFNRIGNFMLLPNSDRGYDKTSLNTYRASWDNQSGWYDYFDLFIEGINNWYNNKNNLEQTFIKLMDKDHNKDYFKALGSFENFVEFNCLEPFFKGIDNINDFYKVPIHSESELKELRKDNKVCYHWMNDNCNSNVNYIEFAKNYVNIATKIIKLRSKIIIKTIKPYIE